MRKFLLSIIMVFLFTGMALAADITISSSVDRTEVEFGDTIELTVSIKKPMENQPMSRSFSNGGFSFSFNSSSFSSFSDDDTTDFNIESIPNFDIAGRRQSSQSRMVNGVGESVKQLVLTLVPQKEGSLVIPAFSMKDGKEHSSSPITVNVKKVAEESDDEDSSTASSSESSNSTTNNNPETKKESLLFNILIYIGILILIVIGTIIAFASYVGAKSRKLSANTDNIEDAVIIKKEKSEEPIQKKEVEKIDFASRYDSLKKLHKEISNEFYRKSFELFKKACCYKSKSLSEDMTYDELLKKIGEIAGTKNIEEASKRLSEDIETVMYANSMPYRKLVELETDMKELLNSL